MGGSSEHRYKTPKDHADGEVYGGFPDMIEEHIPIVLRPGSQQESELGAKQGTYEGTCMVM